MKTINTIFKTVWWSSPLYKLDPENYKIKRCHKS